MARSRKPAGIAAVFFVAAVFQSACVERKLLLRSDPPGAEVAVDGRFVGTTPIVMPFLFYGGRRVSMRLVKHETTTEIVEVNPPWYEWPPLDLVSAVLPFKIIDTREVRIDLPPEQPRRPETHEESSRLVWRAEQMLRRNGIR